jgi:hypothetical protein
VADERKIIGQYWHTIFVIATLQNKILALTILLCTSATVETRKKLS